MEVTDAVTLSSHTSPYLSITNILSTFQCPLKSPFIRSPTIHSHSVCVILSWIRLHLHDRMCSLGSFTFAIKKEKVIDSETSLPTNCLQRLTWALCITCKQSPLFSVSASVMWDYYIDDNIWAESVAGLLWNSLCSLHRQPHFLHLYNKADFYFEQWAGVIHLLCPLLFLTGWMVDIRIT